jgi:hypothetical protein
MAGKILHYRDRFKSSIKICTRCNFVDELPDSSTDCPDCKAPHSLGFWETAERFQLFVQLNKPRGIRSPSEHLQYIIDEAFGVYDVV